MTPESILSYTPKVLAQNERESYFENGYVFLNNIINKSLLDKLFDTINGAIDESSNLKVSNEKFDLEPDHTKTKPRLRRLTQPVAHYPLFWEFTCNSIITDIAEDLLGPNIMFHHSKLNFKWFSGGEEVKWHQDMPFWPHTNDSVLTIGIYLENVDNKMGPLGVIPKSHTGPIFDHYNADGQWVGYISEQEKKQLDLKNAFYSIGNAGSITVHHCRTVHGSKPNTHPHQSRPLLLNTFSSADTLPITNNPTPSRYDRKIIRGTPSQFVHMEPYQGKLPPDWSKGYTSIFSLQQKEHISQ